MQANIQKDGIFNNMSISLLIPTSQINFPKKLEKQSPSMSNKCPAQHLQHTTNTQHCRHRLAVWGKRLQVRPWWGDVMHSGNRLVHTAGVNQEGNFPFGFHCSLVVSSHGGNRPRLLAMPRVNTTNLFA